MTMPDVDPVLLRRIRDEEQLNVLSIVYFVSAGTSLLFGFFALFYVVMGAMMFAIPAGGGNAEGEAAARMVGVLFGSIGALFAVAGWALGAAKIYAGLCLRRHKNRGICIAVAIVSCLGIPYGTVLGVFTLVVLLRESTAKLFAPPAGEPSASPPPPVLGAGA